MGEWPSFIEADEHALVGLATNHECWIFPAGDGFAVWTKPETAGGFMLQLTEREP